MYHPMIANSSDISSFAEHESRALLLESEQKIEEARDAFDAALRLNPLSQACAEGRARIALQLMEDDAVTYCSRALVFHEANPDRQLRMIQIAVAALGVAATSILEEYLSRNPQNIVAHELMAELHAQAGAGNGATDNYLEALRRYPDNNSLLASYWKVLARSGRYAEALESMDTERDRFKDSRDIILLEVNIANHAGLTARAGDLLDQLDDRSDAQLARGQHRLQIGRPDEAAQILHRVVQVQPDNQSAWALLEIAWRMTNDSRHAWLVGQPGLFSMIELSLSRVELGGIAAMLRTQHHGCAQPLGQSVRGGTQTAGQLLGRTARELHLLKEALVTAIGKFVDNLPAPDPRHPLLKYRDRALAFSSSWSVRLAGGGYHAAHIHPGGVISSACYISLPAHLETDPDQSGWLEIGRPPAELGLDLDPLASFEPKPAHVVLFPSFLFHGTRSFDSGERLTVAFDLVPAQMA